MKYVLSIDAGTGSVRSVIFNEVGKEVGFYQIEWEHYKEDGIEGSMNFDYKKNWNLVLESINKALQSANLKKEDISAVTSSSMREGIVLYDEQKNEIWAVANVDARASQEVKELKENFKGIEEKFYKISGQTFALGAIPRLLWLKKHKPNIYSKVRYLTMLSDWILFKLSGILAVEPSNAGTSGIFSLKKRDWESSFLREVGLKDNILPKVYESGEIIGEVKEELGFKECKVVMGGGDVQLGTLGLGLTNIGDSALLGGSFWQQIINIPSNTPPPSDMSIRINPHVIKDISQAEGITFFSGLIMRWFRDAFGCGKSYKELEELAKDVPPGSYGIIPIFSDSMKYGKWYHASPSFLNLSIDSKLCNIASMFRSLEENAAIVSAINIQKIEEFSNVKNDQIIFAAGASKGELWSQIVSDVLGKEVIVPVVKEATSLGGAIYCLNALNVYNSLDEAVKVMVKYQKSFLPNMQNHKLYQDISYKFKKAYKKQLELVDEGVTTSMWRAPGV
jgi:autoinducer 2 (AI-2) kinase